MKSVISKPTKDEEPTIDWYAYTANQAYIDRTLRFMMRWLDDRKLRGKVLNIHIVEPHCDVRLIQFTTTEKIALKMQACPGFLQIRRAN